MTDYALTEADRKRLTEFLGECWHEDELFRCDDGSSFIRCKKCRRPLSRWEPFAFTSPDDRQALCEKLMEKGLWDGFSLYAWYKWWNLDGGNDEPEPSVTGMRKDFMPWLMVEHPERCCKMVSDFWKEKR
jgi:hypothetical protein